ncbi:MAG TPA: hypothetical protein VNA19_14295, partial [Pyrinomonadaceae bacterium]|nr:hypothetical protein [Pyrinomonadaceae bacterium]
MRHETTRGRATDAQQSRRRDEFLRQRSVLLRCCNASACLRIFLAVALFSLPALAQTSPTQPDVRTSPRHFEYLWYEAENMRGLATDARNEPLTNPSWRNLSREKSPGWGINGPGVSAEWTQGGESEWNSAAASADESKASLYQDVEVPRAGQYKIWVRYADWARAGENFMVRVRQREREVFRHEFGAREVVDPHDEVSMYWGWAFTWDASPVATLERGAARISLDIERTAGARRHVDCVLVTNDLEFVPDGRRKPEFAAMRVLREWASKKPTLASLLVESNAERSDVPALWRRPTVAGR